MANELKPGERLWNGRTVTPELARAYNAATRTIEAYRSKGLEPPERLLSGRHNLIS